MERLISSGHAKPRLALPPLLCLCDVAEPGTRRPAVFLEYGTHDELFPFERVALPMKAHLEELGCPLEFVIDEGGRHWPPSEFQPEALDWFFSESWMPRS